MKFKGIENILCGKEILYTFPLPPSFLSGDTLLLVSCPKVLTYYLYFFISILVDIQYILQ